MLKVSGAVCPEGFEIVEARIDGRRQLLGASNLDYCRGMWANLNLKGDQAESVPTVGFNFKGN